MKKHPTHKDTVAILGYGIEGKALHEYLKKKGISNITIIDQHIKGASIHNDMSNLDTYDFVYRSPGIHKDRKGLLKAKRAGVHVSSTTQLFFDHCPCPIIGVTGTKGKGTTSSLIYEILKENGSDTYLGGNIGESPLHFLDDLTPNSIVVLELSSFQLHDITKSPHIAIVLNTTSDHLDYHKDVEEYQSAKEGIVRYQSQNDICIINDDYPYKNRYSTLTSGTVYKVSSKHAVKKGAYLKNKIITISDKGKEYSLCSAEEVGLIGPHNLENIMPAAVACNLIGVSPGTIKKVIKSFTGLPHRLEYIKKVEGVKYYNDSFSTTPETCIAAIKSFDTSLILIAGGSEKHSNFTELGKTIAETDNLKSVILMGETATRIKKSIGKSKKITIADSYQQAFDLAYKNAKKGDVVLLSPASASFDMFRNYKHRGDTFRKWVESL
jgi:UDP-N-acetylmuramoylalanine--D-glutamate ligase